MVLLMFSPDLLSSSYDSFLFSNFICKPRHFLTTMSFVISNAFLSSAECMFVSSWSTNSSRLFIMIESRFFSSTNVVIFILFILLNFMVYFLRIIISRYSWQYNGLIYSYLEVLFQFWRALKILSVLDWECCQLCMFRNLYVAGYLVLLLYSWRWSHLHFLLFWWCVC